MAGRIATITGTMLTPGVSRNKRLYSKELIARAAQRMQERIADPQGLPIVMRTHHEAGDDSVRIVGRLTGVKLAEDGRADYTADLYDTTHGRDIAAIVTGKTPALRSVSIHGYWIGPVKRIDHEGESVTTADDLEVDAVDFTASPGVLGATVTTASYLPDGDPAAESAAVRTAISESAEATIEAVTEDAPAVADEAQYSAQQKRDALAKGQAMKNGNGDPAYTIKTKSDLRKAIKAVGRGGADHDAIRKHVIQRAAALGLSNLIPDNWNKDGSMKETQTRLLDVREYYPDGPTGAAGFCIDAYNGPISMTMRACGLDPAELRAVTQAAMTAAIDALQCMDPDMDADIDVDAAPKADNDDDQGSGETASAPGAPLSEADKAAVTAAHVAGHLQPGTVITAQGIAEAHALPQTTPTTAVVEATPSETESAVSETVTPAAETATRTLSDADISAFGALVGAAIGEALKPVTAALKENANRTAATETAEHTAETPKADKKALKEQAMRDAIAAQVAAETTRIKDELREQIIRENGLPSRKGYRVHENDAPAEPADTDAFKDRASILLGDYGITPSPR